MSTNGLILFVALAFITHMCRAQGNGFELLSKNVEILARRTETCTNETADIRKELGAQKVINEDFGQILEKLSARLNKLETENQALNQTMLELQNDNEHIKAKLNKLQATCTCTISTASSITTVQTTPTEPTTTEPTTIEPTTTEPTTTEPTTTEPTSTRTAGPLYLHQGHCDEGWSEFEGRCYIVVPIEWKTWDDASDYCKNKASFLIEIRTDGQLAFASRLLPDFYAYYWVGATDKRHRGRFVYQHSGLEVPERFWRDGYPERKFHRTCVHMTLSFNQGLEFLNGDCDSIQHFVCEKW